MELHTFTVYEDFCAISVRSHQYCLIVYLLVCQARFAIDDFQELRDRVSHYYRLNWHHGLAWPAAGSRPSRETNSVCNAVREAHELNIVPRTLPVRVEGENQSEGGGLRICRGVGEGNVS